MGNNRVALIILDGWGHGIHPRADALRLANTPFVDSLYRNYPNSELITFGEDVGLPEGQMGNSEVGHINIGAGRVIYQELARINKAIRTGEFKENIIFQKAMKTAKSKDVPFHLMGLLSDGGVHSHIKHLLAIVDYLVDAGVKNICIHAFLDGRDTDPKGGEGYLKQVQDHIKGKPVRIATVVGRYFAMDRDNRWERIKIAYDALVKGEGETTDDLVSTLKKHYAEGTTDEFIKPILAKDNMDSTRIKDGDVVFFYNFRTDRPRQITKALTQEDFHNYEMKKLSLEYFTMTGYDSSFNGIHVVFTKKELTNTLGEVLSKANKSQIRIAETEKYPHVTFFFNGGEEVEYKGESRIMIPSPKVDTYDMQPEMSAPELTEAIIKRTTEDPADFICLNFANTDMVGHTGDFKAAMAAAETVDQCLKKLMEVLLKNDYSAIVIADHGNSDIMINPNGTPNTAHTTNMVPCFYISKDQKGVELKDGKLADVAPTILKLMDITPPEEMTGNILIS